MTHSSTAGLVLGLVFWTVLMLAIAGAAVLAAVAVKRGGRLLIGCSAVLLVAAIVMVALPHPQGLPVFGAFIAIAALTASAAGGSPAVKTVLQLATRDQPTPGIGGGILVAVPQSTEQREVLRGGVTIGVLERLATTACILFGFPEAVAIVIAIKGVGRFSELGASEAQERFIIGTFVSLGWAAACGALAHLAW